MQSCVLCGPRPPTAVIQVGRMPPRHLWWVWNPLGVGFLGLVPPRSAKSAPAHSPFATTSQAGPGACFRAQCVRARASLPTREPSKVFGRTAHRAAAQCHAATAHACTGGCQGASLDACFRPPPVVFPVARVAPHTSTLCRPALLSHTVMRRQQATPAPGPPLGGRPKPRVGFFPE
jgi:hypothetical protein